MDHSIENKQPLGGEGFDLADATAVPSEHDGLMDIISQMESRLAALRDSENQRDRLQDEIKNQFNDLDERERDLRKREAALDGNSSGMQADRAALEAERRRIHDSLGEVGKERESLRTREIEVGVLSETLRRDRELLESRRAQVEATERELKGREQVLVTQTERIDQEAGELEARRKEIELREAALRELEQETRSLGEQQRDREARLGEQEREMRVAQERYQAMQAEVISLNRRLADANGMAAEQSRMVEQARADGQRALAESQKQCEKFESEANRVRLELAKMRRSPGSAEGGAEAGSDGKVGLERRVKHATVMPSPRARSTILAVIWMLTVGVAGLACYLGIALGQPGAAAWLLGLAFAGCFVGGMACSGKPLDPSSLPIVLFGGTFGAWFPRLFTLVANAIETWDLPLGALPKELLPQLPVAVSLLAAGVVVTFGLLFIGASAALVVQSLFATIGATGLALLPDPTYSALGAGALLWHGIMAAGLARWAMGAPEQQAVEDVPIPARFIRGG